MKLQAEDIARLIEQRGLRVRKTGDRWEAQCPAHEDNSPSLHFRNGEKGVVLDCKTGCPFPKICSSLGLYEQDLFWEDKPRIASNLPPAPQSQKLTRYEIKDPSGAYVATLHRLEPGKHKKKDFEWWRNAKKGLDGLGTQDLPLYRSQDIPTFEKNRWVFVTEGAKDCDALRELGLQALGTVTGAALIPSPTVLQGLEGLRVVLWPDHDQGGYEHMRKVGDGLGGVAAEVVYLLPGNPSPKDGAFDWIAKAGAGLKEELGAALDELLSPELPRWEEEEEKTSDAQAELPLSNKEEGEAFDLNRWAPRFVELYTSSHLEAARSRELLSLDSLPQAKDGESQPFYGWGGAFNDLVGGGLGPGDLVALGAASAGAGKTTFLMQLVDGLALRCAHLTPSEEGPLTPVLYLSEMSAAQFTQKRLSWLTGEKGSTWRAGRTAEKSITEKTGIKILRGKGEVDGLYTHAQKLLSPTGSLGLLSQWSRLVRREALKELPPGSLVSTLRRVVRAWVKELKESSSRDIWPVVVLDPIQRWLRKDRPEVEAQNELIEQLEGAADEDGWICFVTSDTNKGSAKGENQGDTGEVGAGVFRGSYALIHGADVACYLGKGEGPSNATTVTVSLKFFKNRLGPSFDEILYHWDKVTGRFREFSHEELTKREDARKKERAEKDTQRTTKNVKATTKLDPRDEMFK